MTTSGTAAETSSTEPYDALLLVSFGGPEGPDEVMPFLERVVAGRGVPPERLEGVAEHYRHFGGVSPINAHNRALVAALAADLRAVGIDLPVAWGNRNSAPFLADALRDLADRGARRVVAVLTSAYSSYSGCRQYREDIAAAQLAVGAAAPRVDKVRHYFDLDGFVAPMAADVVRCLGELPAGSCVAFVTHSVPTSMAASAGPDGGAYVAQHEAVAAAVLDRVEASLGRRPPADLVYCSRSGGPAVPWLEPDVNDHLAGLASQGAPGVVLAPIGFVSDHMEVRWDLDTEAVATAERLGLPVRRSATVGTAADFVAGIRGLVLERAAVARGERAPSTASVWRPDLPSRDVCAAGCCPNPRGPRPAACGEDAADLGAPAA